MGVVRFLVIVVLATGNPYAIGAQTQGDEALDPGMVNPGYAEKPEWFKNSFLDIREDVDEATKAGKRVMLYFYQDGCPYCKKLLQDNLGQREITHKTRAYFQVVAINMWGDREVVDFEGEDTTEKQFAIDLKVMFTPTLFMLNEQGAVVLRINGYFPPNKFIAALDFVGQKLESQTALRDYLAKQTTAPATGKLHVQPNYIQPPYRLADWLKRSHKPLLVLFEQKQCSNCDELHLDIFVRAESKRLLKQFDVVLVDMWSQQPVQTPQGKETSLSRWARELRVNYAPSLVFFNTNGEEVFRTEAYLRAFHTQSVMDYVASRAYLEQPEFQRYISARADALEAQGIEVDLMH